MTETELGLQLGDANAEIRRLTAALASANSQAEHFERNSDVDMNFDKAFERLIGHEGGYSDHPSDPGGATMYGVTQRVARENGYMGDMRDFTLAQSKVIYKKLYWDAVKSDELPVDVRFDIFDGAVNSGVGQSVKWLQRAVGTTDDGKLGPITLAATKFLPGSVVARKYNGHRLMFMCDLKTFTAFGRGWARRIASNLIGD